MSETELIYRMFKDKNFFEGVQSSVEYLTRAGKGIGRLRDIVNEVNENRNKFEERNESAKA